MLLTSNCELAATYYPLLTAYYRLGRIPGVCISAGESCACTDGLTPEEEMPDKWLCRSCEQMVEGFSIDGVPLVDNVFREMNLLTGADPSGPLPACVVDREVTHTPRLLTARSSWYTTSTNCLQ